MPRHKKNKSDAIVTGQLMRSFRLALPDELAQGVHEYAVTNGHKGMSDAARELIAMALASVPEDGVIQATRTRAYYTWYHYVQERIRSALHEIENDVRNTSLDSSPPASEAQS